MKYRGICLLLALLLLFTCCNSGQPEKVNNVQKEALAQEFMAELRDEILPLRNQTARFYSVGVITIEEDGALGEDLLADFLALYYGGQACALTVAFADRKPLVISKFVLDEQGEGFYFRYELNENDAISVTGKPINGARVHYDETDKTNLTISRDKETVATIVFQFLDDS